MRMKRSFQITVLLSAVALFTAFAMAAEQRITFQAGPDAAGASGNAVIKDKEMTTRGIPEKEITISATGLQPNSVYSVWLVNEKPKVERGALGEADHSFNSDASGNGSYTASVSASDLSNWQMIEIAHHTDNNPKNTSNMKTALTAKLQQQMQQQ